MKKLLIFVCCFILAHPCFGAFGAASAWDVRTAGNGGADTNGGAFDAGVAAPGTDESMGAGTAMTIVSAGTTGTCTPACTSTTHGPGNFFHVASGCTVGWYEIISQAAGTVTFDKTTGAGTCVGVFGGSLLTLTQALTNPATYNSINIQTGTYTVTVGITGSGSTILNIIGYQTIHGDNGTCPTITTATNSVNLISLGAFSGQDWKLTNLCLTSTAGTPGTGVIASFQNVWLDHVTVSGFSTGLTAVNSTWVHVTGNSSFTNCSATGVQVGGGAAIILDSVFACANTASGVQASSGMFVIARGNTFNGNSIGLDLGNGPRYDVEGNTFYNNASVGFKYQIGGANPNLGRMFSNAFVNNTCAISLTANPIGGLSNATASGVNAFGNNGSLSCGAVTYTQQASDKTLTAGPFVNAGTGDFTPNSVVGGGLLLKGAGFPLNFDIGAWQSAASAAPPQSTVYGQ